MKRFNDIDAVKAIGICLIVLSHIFGAMGLGENAVWRWLAPFMVGLFFVMSGYLSALAATAKEQRTFAAFRTFAAKKAKRLLVPYAFFSAAALGIKLVVAHMIGGTLREQAEPAIREFVTFLGTGTLWFLPALFFAELLFFWVTRWPRWGRALMLLVSIVAAYVALPLLTMLHYSELYEISVFPWIWGYDYLYVMARSLVAVGLMLLGSDVIPWIEQYRLKRKREQSQRAGFAVVLIGVAVTVLISGVFFPDFRSLNFDHHPILLYIDTLAAAILFLELFRLLERRISLEPIAWIGRNSLIIMCTHNEWLLVPVFRLGLAGVWGMCPAIGVRYYLECGVILALILMTECGICRFLNRYLPWALGKSTDRTKS
ncbi:MAG: acyltransferase family protein [Lachnospiraceae bacterium]|nr:acyltransferase family protein [Lachnospiraceae bacterium]